MRKTSIKVALAYDGYGRMTGYARQGEVSLTHGYNGNDDRVSTTTTSAATATPDTRRFVYDAGGRVLGEYGSSASDARAEFIWLSPEVGASSSFGGDDGLSGYMPLAVAANDNIAGPQLLWVHANHMGVPAVYTNAAGAVINAPSGYSAPGFPGQSRTPGLGGSDLYYNHYRDYDPTTGRYIQADPIGLAGGASPYSYAMNNPLRYTDPTGLNPVLAARGAGAVGRGLGAGLTWWCRRNMAACMRTIGPTAIRISNAVKNVSKFCYDYADGDEPDEDGPCEFQKSEDELECNQWNITGGRDGYSRIDGLAACYKSVADRYSECIRHGPGGIRTKLFLPTRRRGIPDPKRRGRLE